MLEIKQTLKNNNNTGHYLQDLGLGKNFLDMTPKTWFILKNGKIRPQQNPTLLHYEGLMLSHNDCLNDKLFKGSIHGRGAFRLYITKWRQPSHLFYLININK